jgi:hypothetical protein
VYAVPLEPDQKFSSFEKRIGGDSSTNNYAIQKCYPNHEPCQEKVGNLALKSVSNYIEAFIAERT